jgi:hypothetical protein
MNAGSHAAMNANDKTIEEYEAGEATSNSLDDRTFYALTDFYDKANLADIIRRCLA